MVRVIKLRGGLSLPLAGAAVPPPEGAQRERLPLAAEYCLDPRFFVGLKPKVVVREGDAVCVGTPLFVDKTCEAVRCVSPVAGTVSAVVRGERRQLLGVRVRPSVAQPQVPLAPCALSTAQRDDILSLLTASGLFAYITQLPYAVVASPTDVPKAIFVSALRDMPLEGAFETELRGQEEAFQAGLTALSKIAKTFLGIGSQQTAPALTEARDVEVTAFAGRCPAGNVGVHVNHLCPVNKGEVVWTVDPTVVLFIGRLITTGALDLTRTVAVGGAEVRQPQYVDALVGTPLRALLDGQIATADGVRIINGNPLTGVRATLDDGFLGAHTSAVCVIAEGAHADELLGWLLPRLNDFSVSRSYCSWLLPKRRYRLDARVKGGARHMIMSGEYDRMLPMDIYGEYLIKALLAGNIDRQEALGIYEVSPEDFAVAEFVCSSKLELQKIVRQGLDILRKENA